MCARAMRQYGRAVVCIGDHAALHGPNPQPFRDGLIAATALVHNLVVVTRNLADVQASGVRLLNPWRGGVTAPAQHLHRPGQPARKRRW